MNQKINKLIQYLSKLPGIGPRQATRLALALTGWDKEDLREFGSAVHDVQNTPLFCQQCFNFSDNKLCSVCLNPKRNPRKIMVVEKVTDLRTIESTGVHNGVYHVLGGVLDPTANGGSNNIRIKELAARIKKMPPGDQIEVIIATNPNVYGETTAMYITEKLKLLGVSVTRLAQGLSSGSIIEYSDEITLANALKHRR